MIRRIRIQWPDPRPFHGREGQPIRFLAISDEADRALEFEVNRRALEPLDGLLGCGDLEPSWLDFVAGCFSVPLVYVRGNHDHGGAWEDESVTVPGWLGSGDRTRVAGVAIGGLEWPGVGEQGNARRPWLAWRHALRLAARQLAARVSGRSEPMIVISHAPPEGAGDAPSDAYHAGFGGYRWLLHRLRPPLWLHGHTTTASVPALVARNGPTTLVNVTGAVLVELCPRTEARGRRASSGSASGTASTGGVAPPGGPSH
jgi:Icc-related predicted phosphoesterase